jgi:hypothetical protein
MSNTDNITPLGPKVLGKVLSDTDTVPTPLKPVDRAKRLAELEEEIRCERDMSAKFGTGLYFKSGICLKAIRDEELYRERWLSTFRSYLQAVWRMSDEECACIIECSEGSQKILRFVREHEGKGPVRVERLAAVDDLGGNEDK